MYLLDTTVISDIVNASSGAHATAMQFVNSKALSADQVHICAVTVGEMWFGRELQPLRTPPPAQEKVDEVNKRLAELQRFAPLPITHHVAREYGRLRATYAHGVVPKLLGPKLKGKAVELWQQQVPSLLLRITENDLWIAAAAITHDLILVSRDKDFDAVKRHCEQLRLLRI